MSWEKDGFLEQENRRQVAHMVLSNHSICMRHWFERRDTLDLTPPCLALTWVFPKIYSVPRGAIIRLVQESTAKPLH
jgi:hypothetical protein